MKPTIFPEQNFVLTAEGCDNLPVFTNGEVVISKWIPSEDDLQKINNGEGIYLVVYSGESSPPVFINAGSPFTYPTNDTSSTENATEGPKTEA